MKTPTLAQLFEARQLWTSIQHRTQEIHCLAQTAEAIKDEVAKAEAAIIEKMISLNIRPTDIVEVPTFASYEFYRIQEYDPHNAIQGLVQVKAPIPVGSLQ